METFAEFSEAWQIAFEVDKGEKTEVAIQPSRVSMASSMPSKSSSNFASRRCWSSPPSGMSWLASTIPIWGRKQRRLEAPHRIDPYTEFTLRRVTPPQWKKFDG